jgi:hypothetical protein
MGWEYEGDENSFWEFCDNNASNEGFESFSSGEMEVCIISFFLEKLEKNILFEKHGCSHYQLKLTKDKLKDVLGFLEESNLYLNYNAYGEKISNLSSYESKIRQVDEHLFNLRNELASISEELRGHYCVEFYFEQKERQKELKEEPNRFFGKLSYELILDCFFGRHITFKKFSGDIIFQLLTIATLYDGDDYCSYGSSSFREIEIYSIASEKYGSEFYKSSDELDLNNDINPFSPLLSEYLLVDYESTYRLIDKFKRAFNFILSLEGIRNSLYELKVDLDESNLTIKLYTNKYSATIERDQSIQSEDKLILTLSGFLEDENREILKIVCDQKLIPLKSHGSDDAIKKGYKQERAHKRSDLNLNALLNEGRNLLYSDEIDCYVGDLVDRNIENWWSQYPEISCKRVREVDKVKIIAGENILVNGFDFKIVKTEFGNYKLTGLINEKGIRLMSEAQALFGFAESNCVQDHIQPYDTINIFEELIESILKCLPSSVRNDYCIGDTFVFFNSFVKIKEDNIGYVYIEQVNNEEQLFFEYYDLNKQAVFNEIVGYYLPSHKLVFKSLKDLNFVITSFQQMIERHAIEKNSLLKVGDKVQFNKSLVGVIYQTIKYNRMCKPHFNLGYINSDDKLGFAIDSNQLRISADWFSTEILKKKYSFVANFENIFESFTLKALTYKVKLFEQTILNLKNYNDATSLPNAYFYVGGGYYLYFYEKKKSEWCISYRVHSGIGWLFNSNKIDELELDIVFNAVGISRSDLSYNILGYYKGDAKNLFFNSKSDLVLFVEHLQLQANKFFERIVDFSQINVSEILQVNDIISCRQIKVCVVANSKGYYLKSGEEFSQYYLCENLKSGKIIDFFENRMGYYIGGVFPYCKSLFHLSIFIHYLNENSKNSQL